METMGFEPTTIRLEVRCSTVEAISPSGPNKVGTVFDLTSSHVFCEVFYALTSGIRTGYVMTRYGKSCCPAFCQACLHRRFPVWKKA